MRRKIPLVIFVSVLVFSAILPSYTLNSTYRPTSNVDTLVDEKPTTWYSPEDILPKNFEETEEVYESFRIELKYDTIGSSINRICILVSSSVYNDISSSLNQYVADVESLGFSVSVYSGSWGAPEDVRTLLQQGLLNGLDGCLLIGDIPAAWYEMDNPSPWGHEEFPVDLYYMDLNGNWMDIDEDGIYDEHSGDLSPEIWVGRLKASNLDGDEDLLLTNYFRKNHYYRAGISTLPQRALVYVDDDWYFWADWDDVALKQLYGETTLVKDKVTTNAEDYKSRLTQGYEWIHLRCHGSASSHTFEIPIHQWGGTVYSSDYRSINPDAFFYQLFVCSAARYTENNYLGGSCIFTDTNGLLAIGSTKTGGMRYFDDFYESLAEGSTIGDAFKQWFIMHGESDPKWFYGLTILGDPLLRPCMHATEGLYLVVRGLNNRIYYRIYNSSGGSWDSWNGLPSGMTCDSPAVAVCCGKLHMVVRGFSKTNVYGNYTLWYGWINLTDGSFHGWTWLSGLTSSAPTLACYDSQVILVVRGLNNRVYCRSYDCVSDEWGGWFRVLTGVTCDSPAAAVLGDELHLAIRGYSATNVYGNYSLWHGSLNLTTGGFSGWTRIGLTPSAPTLAASQTLNGLCLVVRGLNNRIYQNTWNGTDWEGWTALPTGSTCDSPRATTLDDELHIVVRGVSGTSLWHCYTNLSTDDHSGWNRISGATPSAPTLTS